jgi:hypothetical protein
MALEQIGYDVDPTTSLPIKGRVDARGTKNNTNPNPRRLPEDKIHRGSYFTGNLVTFQSRHNFYKLNFIDYYRRKNFRRKEKCKKPKQLLL